MTTDVLLLSTPNKNIDYPALSLPALTAALRQRGISVEQRDLNATFRDEILTATGLTGLLESTLPSYAERFRHSEVELSRLLSLYQFFKGLQATDGFEALEDVKKHAQARDYEWVFGSDGRFRHFLSLFKINRALHYLIDIAVTISYEKTDDYLTQKLRVTLDRLRDDVLAMHPLVAGFSVLDIQRKFALRAIETIRPVFQGKIVVGGADPTRFPKEYIEWFKAIDAVFCREAENSLPMYVESLETPSHPLSKVPGIFYRDDQGKTCSTRQLPVVLSDLPTPDFRGLPLNIYLTPALPVEASRGCYYHRCTFCIHWDTYFDFRWRDPAKVVADMRALTDLHGTKFFHFTDDCLPVPKALRLARLIRESGLNIRWLSYFRLEDALDKNALKQVWDAGGRVLEMGLESASDRILTLMEKNISVDVADRIVRDASSIGLLVKLFMFHGYPGETVADAEKTVRFTEEHITARRIRPFLPLRNRFELLRGSQIYESVRSDRQEMIARYWLPSGLFGIRAEYELSSDENPTRALISGFVERTRRYMREKRIYNTDDENVMLDLLVLDKKPIKAGWDCI